VSLPRAKYTDSSLVREYYRTALERIAAVPGVSGVTATSNPPFGGGNSSTSLEIEGKPTGPGVPLREAEQRTVMPGYFETLQVPILAGRGFGTVDRTGGALVVIVSQSLAHREWPNESALGRQVKFQGAWREVIGVVGDTRFSKLSAEPQAMIYAPSTQRAWFGLTLLVRTTVDPLSLTASVRRALNRLDPAVPFLGADTMEELIRRSSVEERYRTTLVSLFGLMAGILAAVGMYGVATRAASRRTREMGIRIALGARSGNVVRLLVRTALTGVVGGLVMGVIGATLAGRWLAPFLYGVAPDDRLSFALSAALLAGASLVATWFPARRAAGVAPAIVLRAE
jgi:predicted permease